MVRGGVGGGGWGEVKDSARETLCILRSSLCSIELCRIDLMLAVACV